MKAEIFDCEGAPRDMGLDDARATGSALGDTLAEARRQLLAPGGLSIRPRLARRRELREVARAIQRHFPHLAERTIGFTKGSGLARDAVWPLLARELHWREGCYGSVGGMAIGFCAERTADRGPGLAKLIDLPPNRAQALCLRRSAPENDHRSLELCLAGLPAAIAGVNEQGLAIAVAASELDTQTQVRVPAPGVLFVQDCLQRFSSAENAAQWCCTRPASGRLSLVFADAVGEVVGVEIDGDGRRLLRPEGDLLCAGRSAGIRAAKPLLETRTQWDAAAFFAALAEPCGENGGDLPLCRHESGLATAAVLWLSPRERSLTWSRSCPCARQSIVAKL